MIDRAKLTELQGKIAALLSAAIDRGDEVEITADAGVDDVTKTGDEFVSHKHNGTQTITIRINGGAQDNVRRPDYWTAAL